MNEVNEVIQILDEIAMWTSKKRALFLCNRLRKINKKNWNDYYEELIYELEKDDKFVREVDYQMLWFECLGFPKICSPLLRDYKGNTHGCYGSLESDFNKVSGFHDSNINFVTCENNSVTLFIDMYGEWGITNKEKFDYILNFEEVFAIYYGNKPNQSTKLKRGIEIDNIMGKPIISIDELPAIKYILNGFNIEYDCDLIKYRLFCVDLGMEHICGMDHIIIFAKKWELKHVGA